METSYAYSPHLEEMDDASIALVGATIGASSAIGSVTISSWLQKRQEHLTWL